MTFSWMNNIKIPKKLILMFAICVLVPTIVTNSFFVWSVNSNYKKQQQAEMENIADRINLEISSYVNELISISDYLNRNKDLYTFLSTDYATEADYYSAFNDLLADDVIHYYYTSQSVYCITICTDNPTITNGSYFVQQADMEETSWYQYYTGQNLDTVVYSYFEDGMSGGYIEKGRHIVVIRRLDYYGGNNIIMLDLDYDSLFDSISLECNEIGGKIYDQDGRILFENTYSSNKKKAFGELDQSEREDFDVTQPISFSNCQWYIGLTNNQNLTLNMLKEQRLKLLLLYLLNLIIPSVFIYILYRSLHDRISMTQKYMEKVKVGEYEEIELEEGRDKDEIGDMLRSFNLMVGRIKELIEVVFKNKEKEQELEIAKKQAELNALHSQINPHFMFNALESIRMHSVLKNEKDTAQILSDFSILLRRNIQWNSDYVTLEDECENTRRYLEIQKYRFGDRLDFSVSLQPECKQYVIPKFAIITFVENSCVHGIEDSIDGGSISVIVSEDEDKIYIEILDSGKGMTSQELEELRALIKEANLDYLKQAKASVGIVNTIIRLRQTFGEAFKFEINSTLDEGTEICFVVSKLREKI